MATDFAPKQRNRQNRTTSGSGGRAAATGRGKARRPRRTAPRTVFHAPSFSAGIVLGAVLLALGLYAPRLLESHLPAAPTQPRAEAPFRFEFHDLLARGDEPPEAIDVQTPEALQAAPAGAGQDWFVQAGSFRNPQDAERLTARLLLVDLPAAMSTVKLDDGRWYRVTVGPFETRTESRRAMTALRQQDISALLFARPRNGGNAG